MISRRWIQTLVEAVLDRLLIVLAKVHNYQGRHLFFKSVWSCSALIKQDLVLAGHDISSGGLIHHFVEMCFPAVDIGLSVDLKDFKGDLITSLFSEKPPE